MVMNTLVKSIKNHPKQIQDMEPQNGDSEDEFPFHWGDVQVPYQYSRE